MDYFLFPPFLHLLTIPVDVKKDSLIGFGVGLAVVVIGAGVLFVLYRTTGSTRYRAIG
jgi:hypothetical protein